jgi:hypothetical protein
LAQDLAEEERDPSLKGGGPPQDGAPRQPRRSKQRCESLVTKRNLRLRGGNRTRKARALLTASGLGTRRRFFVTMGLQMSEEQMLLHELFSGASHLPSSGCCIDCDEIISDLCNNELVRKMAIFSEVEGVAKPLHERIAKFDKSSSGRA